ncbi:MAG: Obg family GTPase CgtA [Candidatus Omnitrophica bacterium]|nr:Obg family GTPase CgtA [Candidatus Omnitrophota bacterium]
MIFVDEISIVIESGNGGKGCESFFRRTDKKMVPNGGDGGDGGDVIIRADRNITGLYSFRFHHNYRAESGAHGSSNLKKGRDGKDLLILVPCGTTVFNKQDRLLIRDLVEEGDEVVALRGGRGGKGNGHHGKMAQPGQRGQEMEVVFNLRLNADIFLVGFPNSGKSLLLNCLTGSKAKSEPYPFTTQSPQLGMFETPDFQNLSLCELPSLAKGASRGKGLGNQFLKHLERARLMILMADPFQDAFDPKSAYNDLLAELSAFHPGWSSIPHFFAVSKRDLPEVREKMEGKREDLPCPVFFVSAVTGEGTAELMEEAQKVLAKERHVSE